MTFQVAEVHSMAVFVELMYARVAFGHGPNKYRSLVKLRDGNGLETDPAGR